MVVSRGSNEARRALVVRRCTDADAAAACKIMRRSIEELCVLDHGNDQAVLASWLKNKTPEQLAPYLRSDDCFAVIAVRDSTNEGFGLLGKDGELKLCYVLPEAARSGIGSAILKALEKQAIAWRLNEIVLTSTSTARAFYEHHGYVASGAPVTSLGVQRAQPMVKRLVPMPRISALEKELRILEEQLLCNHTSSIEPSALLAEDFVEFGSSGAVYNKAKTLEALRAGKRPQRSMSDFSVVELAKGVALARYRVARQTAPGQAPVYSLRSSLWKRIKGRWQMVFHQGTLSSEQSAP